MNTAEGLVTIRHGAGAPGTAGAVEYCDLLIIDEMLPCDFSPFRNLEYSHYLSYFESSLLLTFQGWRNGYSNLNFDDQLAASSLSDECKAKVRPFSSFPRIVPKLAYITFLTNAWQALPFLEERNIPFILQLYPGGGFEINDEESDRRLKQILHSPLCAKVIVTQNLTRDYLLNRIVCAEEKIKFIYGGVYDTKNEFDFFRDKKLYGRDKTTLDICFVAHRYGDDVKKKGYDQFVAVAKALSAQHPDVRFHVVGDYTPDQIPLEHATEKVTFHGRKPNSFFKAFYPQMDIILSANRPSNEDRSGAFDGFPTGACMEAGFRGVLNCISDPLSMNIAFHDGEDIVLVNFETSKTIARLGELIADVDKLYELSYANWRSFLKAFDTNSQLWERSRLINLALLQPEALIIRPPVRLSDLDASRIAEMRVQVAAAHANFEDATRRHDNLLGEYLKLSAGFDELHSDHVALIDRANTLEAVSNARQASGLSDQPPVIGQLDRAVLRVLHSRYVMRLRKAFTRTRSVKSGTATH